MSYWWLVQGYTGRSMRTGYVNSVTVALADAETAARVNPAAKWRQPPSSEWLQLSDLNARLVIVGNTPPSES